MGDGGGGATAAWPPPQQSLAQRQRAAEHDAADLRQRGERGHAEDEEPER
jgi:hypothetical protein